MTHTIFANDSKEEVIRDSDKKSDEEISPDQNIGEHQHFTIWPELLRGKEHDEARFFLILINFSVYLNTNFCELIIGSLFIY